MKYAFHIIVLLTLSVAESFRLHDFYVIVTKNSWAAWASAFLCVSIVFYLAFYGYRWSSRWATLLCIILSLASFISPLQSEFKKHDSENQAEKLLEYPKWDRRQAWTGKETYDTLMKKETARIDIENENIMLRNSEIRNQREFSLYFWHLILVAVVLGICVPILNYIVSHKISDLYNYDRKINFDNSIQDILKKSGFTFRESVEKIELDHSDDSDEPPSDSSDMSSEYSKTEIIEQSKPGRKTVHIASKKRKYQDDSPSLPFPFMEELSFV